MHLVESINCIHSFLILIYSFMPVQQSLNLCQRHQLDQKPVGSIVIVDTGPFKGPGLGERVQTMLLILVSVSDWTDSSFFLIKTSQDAITTMTG